MKKKEPGNCKTWSIKGTNWLIGMCAQQSTQSALSDQSLRYLWASIGSQGSNDSSKGQDKISAQTE